MADPADPAGDPRHATALIVIPTVDEHATVAEAVTGVRAAGAHVLVVDDGSTDGTLDVVESLAAADHGVHLRARGRRLGLGSAYREGLAWGCAQGYDVVGEMDADLSHDPADLPRLLRAVGPATGTHMAIGSRYVPGGGVMDWPWSRRLLSRGGNLYVRLWTGLPVSDATAGYRVYRREVVEAIDLPSVAADGYAFQIEMALRAWLAGYRIAEVPITFTERQQGASKMSRAIVAEALWRVPMWGVQTRRGARRPVQRRHPAPG